MNQIRSFSTALFGGLCAGMHKWMIFVIADEAEKYYSLVINFQVIILILCTRR